MNKKAIIFGIKGHSLNKQEKIFFKRNIPWGIILFSRNIKNISQLKILIDDIKRIFRNKNFPVMIDVEGGRVSRLNKIIDLSIFSQNYFSKLYKKKNKELFFNYYNIYINAICKIFRSVGININTVPVLDVSRKKTHSVIGNRSFSKNPKKVSLLGNLCINYYKKNKIACVVKHIPGHGLARSDSHYKTPIIRENKKELIKKDFKPFKECKSLLAMTAHVVYEKIDPNNTATHSKIIINEIIREHIKFKGILISDDISMNSLKYSINERAIKALKAGCNLVLHCNGKINEMRKLAKVIPKIDKFTQKKTSDFYKFIG